MQCIKGTFSEKKENWIIKYTDCLESNFQKCIAPKLEASICCFNSSILINLFFVHLWFFFEELQNFYSVIKNNFLPYFFQLRFDFNKSQSLYRTYLCNKVILLQIRHDHY